MAKKKKGQPIDLKSLNSGAFGVLAGDDSNDERGLSDAESVKNSGGSGLEVLDMQSVATALSVSAHTDVCTGHD
jgi:hypothetical protein